MSDNRDALERGYEAFNNGDAETLSEIFDDGVDWEGPNTEGLPMSGKHEGKDAVLEALSKIGDDFESFTAKPDEMVEEDDTIVVLSHLEGKTKAGNDVKLPGIEVWRMSDGKAKRVQSLVDTAEMKKALEDGGGGDDGGDDDEGDSDDD